MAALRKLSVEQSSGFLYFSDSVLIISSSRLPQDLLCSSQLVSHRYWKVLQRDRDPLVSGAE